MSKEAPNGPFDTTSMMPAKSFLALIAGSFSIAFFLGSSFYRDSFGVQTPLAVTLVILLVLGITRNNKRSITTNTFIYAIIAFGLSLFIAIRASGSLTAYNFFGMLAALTLMAESLHQKTSWLTIGSYLKIPLVPFRAFVSLLYATTLASRNFSVDKTKQSMTKNAIIIRGIVIAALLVFIFGALLSSADQAFDQLIPDLPSFQLSNYIIFQLWFTLFVGIAIASGVAFATARPNPGPSLFRLKAFLQPVELRIILGALNTLFLLFLIVQFVYLFGGRDVVLDNNTLTYAEYARSGFFQLLFVTMGVIAISYLAQRWWKGRDMSDGIHKNWIQWGLTALLLQAGIVALSALKRMSLYEDAFGYTMDRLYARGLMYVLIILLASTAVWVWRKIQEGQLLQMTVLLIFGYLIILNVINPEALVAQRNIDVAVEEKRSLDLYYISTLSSDAVEQQVAALTLYQADPSVAEGGLDSYQRDYQKSKIYITLCSYEQYDAAFSGTNLSWSSAHKALQGTHANIAPCDTLRELNINFWNAHSS